MILLAIIKVQFLEENVYRPLGLFNVNKLAKFVFKEKTAARGFDKLFKYAFFRFTLFARTDGKKLFDSLKKIIETNDNGLDSILKNFPQVTKPYFLAAFWGL